MSVPSGTKFIGISQNVDTLERKSNQVNSTSQVYTIDDITYTSRPYKVYTALLTQDKTGRESSFTWRYGDDPAPELPELLKGVTYYISSNDSLTDFTVCGSPSNEPDTYFVANGIQPKWISPNVEGTIDITWHLGAPTTNVLDNTIGNVYFTYSSAGEYTIIVPNEERNNLAVFSHPFGYAITGDVLVLGMKNRIDSPSSVSISTTNGVESADVGFTNLSVEIRLYY